MNAYESAFRNASLSIVVQSVRAADILIGSRHDSAEDAVKAIAFEHGADAKRTAGGVVSTTVRVTGDVAAVWSAIQIARGRTDTALPVSAGAPRSDVPPIEARNAFKRRMDARTGAQVSRGGRGYYR